MRSLKLCLLALFALALAPQVRSIVVPTASEAPTGFDNLTNGFTSQVQFDSDRDEFEEREEIESGLGPVYNAQSCVECHQSPVTGAISQVTELRAGHRSGNTFTDHPGGR